MFSLRAVWGYRYFIFSSVLVDFKSRFTRSKLGVLWLVIAPLSQVLIYAFVLSALMTQRLPGVDTKYSYAIYLLAGFVGWFLFIEILTRSLTVFIDNANVLKKISFPRVSLPIILVISSIINNVIFIMICLIIFYLLGFSVSIHIFWLPVLVIVNSMFAASLGICAGVLNVFIRDIGLLFNVAIQFLFWLTPIVYTISIIPEHLRFIIYANPVYWIVEAYHDVIVFGRAPNLYTLVFLSIGAILLTILALKLFRKSSAEMVDVL